MKYVFPSIMSEGTSIVRYYSDINQWIDFVVVFNNAMYSRTSIEQIVDHAMDSYWDEGSKDYYQPYGDVVKKALVDHGVERFLIVFHDTDNESDEYEDAWEEFIGSFDKYGLHTTICGEDGCDGCLFKYTNNLDICRSEAERNGIKL